MLCGLKTILTDMNILNSYRHIRPKKVKYPLPEIPDDSGKKSGTDWVLPKIIGSGRVSGTRQALVMTDGADGDGDGDHEDIAHGEEYSMRAVCRQSLSLSF